MATRKPLSFHPVQKASHFRNCVNSANSALDESLRALDRLEADYAKARAKELLRLQEVIERKNAVLTEIRKLLPDLRGFSGVHKQMSEIEEAKSLSLNAFDRIICGEKQG